MNKDTLQQINNLAVFIFDDKEYSRFINFIKNKQFNDARIFIDQKIKNLEYLLFEVRRKGSYENLLSQYTKTDELQDIVMDLNISNVEYGEGKQIRSNP